MLPCRTSSSKRGPSSTCSRPSALRFRGPVAGTPGTQVRRHMQEVTMCMTDVCVYVSLIKLFYLMSSNGKVCELGFEKLKRKLFAFLFDLYGAHNTLTDTVDN